PKKLQKGSTTTQLSAHTCPTTINNAIANPLPTFKPKIPGSANGFLVTLCIIAPLIAKAAPAKIVIIILGSLNSIKISVSVYSPCPINVLKNVPTDILYSPDVILQAHANSTNMISIAIVNVFFRLNIGSIIVFHLLL